MDRILLVCLHREHVLVLGNHSIPAFYLGGRCYLEKCATFHALGKLHVIRCSSYRNVDRLLAARGLSPLQHFLADSGGGGSKGRRGAKTAENRTRRNHIRWEETSNRYRYLLRELYTTGLKTIFFLCFSSAHDGLHAFLPSLHIFVATCTFFTLFLSVSFIVSIVSF
jgi:hypothetical protein